MAILRKRNEEKPRKPPVNKKFYQSHRWHEYSRQYRKKHPLCVLCLKQGITMKSECVDHRTPMNQGGSQWNPENHQALCFKCHNQKTANENKGWNRQDD